MGKEWWKTLMEELDEVDDVTEEEVTEELHPVTENQIISEELM